MKIVVWLYIHESLSIVKPAKYKTEKQLPELFYINQPRNDAVPLIFKMQTIRKTHMRDNFYGENLVFWDGN